LDLVSSGHVVEPLKDLYKDEVRQLGTLLGLPESIVWRHPVPGPGLSINVLCAHGDESFPEIETTLKEVRDCLKDCECDHLVLPVRSVGVEGDQRTYASPVARLNTPLDWDWLESQATRITNEVRSVNRVVLLLGSNGQLGWELQRSIAMLGKLKVCDRNTVDFFDLAGLRNLRQIQPAAGHHPCRQTRQGAFDHRGENIVGARGNGDHGENPAADHRRTVGAVAAQG